MGYEIERSTPCRVVLTNTVGSDEVREEREHVVADFVRAARIDGFRKGKAPRALVERRFATEIREDLEEHLTRRAWEQVRHEEKLRVASPLGIREANWLEGGEFRVKGEFDVYPEVELPGLEGFAPPAFEIVPTDEDLTGAMLQLQERQAVWEPVEGEPAGDGMLVEAEVHGEFPEGGGEPFHEERSLFQLGQDEVYPEIEGAVRGHAVGEEVTAERTIGEEVTADRTIGEEGGEERRGTRTSYRVRIKSLRRKRLPEVDDGFAKSVGVEEGVETLRARLRERLRAQKADRRRDAWREALIAHLAGGKVLDLPEGPVREETRRELVEFAQSLAGRGIDPERAKVDWEKLEKDVRSRVEHRLRGETLLDALAEKLGGEVSDADVDHEVEHQAARIGVPFAELRGNLAKSGGLERVGEVLRRERAVDEVLGRFVEKSGA
ncbi:MAG: trigger factor [Thermoanaerobaculaceae bacterium]|nr:trigger factor [Thermoanaerobaculaceae bacterium]